MRQTYCAALLAATCLIAHPAAAQDDIVVTGLRTPAPGARMPARIDVLDRNEIEARAIATLTEALGAASVQAGGAGQQASLFLRGANSKHALALYDGIRLNDASTPNAQYDFGLDTLAALARVEVLRGPASAVYGADAVGGVVNMIPRRGADEAFAPFFELAGGSLSTHRALVGAAGSTGGFDYGVSADVFSTGGHDLVPARMAAHTGDEDAARTHTAAVSARQDFGGFALDALARIRDSRTEFDTFSGGAFFDLRADDPDLENESLQRLWRLGGELDLGAHARARVSGGQVTSERAEIDGGLRTSGADSTRDFADLAFTYATPRLLLTTGAAYERNAIETQPQFASPLSAEEEQFAAFVIAQAGLGDHLFVTAALRGDDYETFGSQTNYSLGLTALVGGLRAYVSYATAFKAPSLSERFETSLFNIGNPSLRPEESVSWEAGAEFAVGERVRAGASYYQTRVDDLIEYDFFQLRNVNIGEAEIDGADAFVAFAPAEWLTFRAEYAWTDVRNGVTGAQLVRRPEHAGRIEVEARPWARFAAFLSWEFVGARSDVTYDNAGAFLSPAGRVEAYDVGALSLRYAIDDSAEVFVRVDNLADAVYEQPAAFAGAPRTALIGFRARR